MVRAQALPNTTRSSRELAPSRLAPWTLAQAASPQAYSPGTTLSCPLIWVIAWWGQRNCVTLSGGYLQLTLTDDWALIIYLSLVVCGYSSHIVMNCGQDRDGLFSDVDSSKDHGRLWDTGQPCGQLLGRQVVKLQVHVVLIWTNTPEGKKTDRNKDKYNSSSFLGLFKWLWIITFLHERLHHTHTHIYILSIPALSDLYGHGAGHHISGGQVFGVGCIPLHEALSLTVDQDPPLTTATLCDQTTSSVDPCKDSQVKGIFTGLLFLLFHYVIQQNTFLQHTFERL